MECLEEEKIYLFTKKTFLGKKIYMKKGKCFKMRSGVGSKAVKSGKQVYFFLKFFRDKIFKFIYLSLIKS